MVELGVAVVQPNVRGSNGYGATFVSLDDGYGREDSARDLGAVIDWVRAARGQTLGAFDSDSNSRHCSEARFLPLDDDVAPPRPQVRARPAVDAGRVAVWGGSYGGYLACVATPHRAARGRRVSIVWGPLDRPPPARA